MHLVELLLPLHDNSGQPFRAEKYAEVRQHLTERFGGLTAFTRSPAQGTTTESGRPVHDEIIVFEVVTKTWTSRGGEANGFTSRRNFGRMKS